MRRCGQTDGYGHVIVPADHHGHAFFRHTGHKGSRKHDAVGSEQDAGKTVHRHKAETFFPGHDGNAAAAQVQLSAVFGYFKDEIRHVFLKKGSLPRIFCMGNEPFRDVIKQ